MNGRVIHSDATFFHHFFNLALAPGQMSTSAAPNRGSSVGEALPARIRLAEWRVRFSNEKFRVLRQGLGDQHPRTGKRDGFAVFHIVIVRISGLGNPDRAFPGNHGQGALRREQNGLMTVDGKCILAHRYSPE